MDNDVTPLSMALDAIEEWVAQFRSGLVTTDELVCGLLEMSGTVYDLTLDQTGYSEVN